MRVRNPSAAVFRVFLRAYSKSGGTLSALLTHANTRKAPEKAVQGPKVSQKQRARPQTGFQRFGPHYGPVNRKPLPRL